MIANTDLAHDLAQSTLRCLLEKVQGMDTNPENYGKFRNIQKTAEALFETLQPEEETKERVKGNALRKGQFETLQPGE